MKRITSTLLITLLLLSCLSLYAFAAEETTAQSDETTAETTEETAEETTEAETVQQQPLHIFFNGDVIGKKSIIQSAHDMNKGGGTISKTGEWQGIKIDIKSPEDPHIGLNYANYISKMGFDPQNIEDSPFIVLKVLADEIAFDDFEIYYCTGDVTAPTEECKTASDFVHDADNGELYLVFDLTGDAEGEMHLFRVDITGAEEGALMYLTEMVFFATEDEALEWCGYYSQDEATTEAATEAETETETETEQATTKAPAQTTEADTVAKKEGCSGVIGLGAVAMLMLAVGTVCLKKKD